MLYVEDSRADRELASFLLGKCGVEVVAVESPSEALAIDDPTQFDAIMTDHNLPGMTGAELAKALRGKGYTGPIIAVTADDSDETRDEIRANGCTTHVLIKPYDIEDLLGLLRTHLSEGQETDGGGEPLMSTMWDDVTMRPLILRFLDTLQKQTHQVVKLLANEDRTNLQKLCSEMKGSAKGYGYNEISRTALEVKKMATAGIAFDRIRAKAKELTQLCVAACRIHGDS